MMAPKGRNSKSASSGILTFVLMGEGYKCGRVWVVVVDGLKRFWSFCLLVKILFREGNWVRSYVYEEGGVNVCLA